MYDSPIDIQVTQQLGQRYVRGITWPKVGFPGGSVWRSKLQEGFLSAVLANSMFNMCRKIMKNCCVKFTDMLEPFEDI